MNHGVSDGTNSLVQEGLQCEIVVRRVMTSCEEGGQTETTDSGRCTEGKMHTKN